MLDSLVRVSRRDDEKHFVRVTHKYDRKSETSRFHSLLPYSVSKPNRQKGYKYPKRPTASHRFLSSNFRYYFTLFSKFFSSFPHGTCSLLVSHPYLALEGIYLPLRAAIPNNSTLRREMVDAYYILNGAITLQGVPSQATLMQTISPIFSSADYISVDYSLSLSRFTRRYWGNTC